MVLIVHITQGSPAQWDTDISIPKENHQLQLANNRSQSEINGSFAWFASVSFHRFQFSLTNSLWCYQFHVGSQ